MGQVHGLPGQVLQEAGLPFTVSRCSEPPMPITPASSPRAQAQARLRDRAVLHDAEQRDNLYARIRNAPHMPRAPHRLTPAQGLVFTFLAQAQAAGQQPRCEPRSPKALINRLLRMWQENGPLVMLRLSHPQFDGYSLFIAADREAIVSGSQWAVTGLLGVHGKGVKAITAVVERGCLGMTHTHFVVPLRGLSSLLKAELLAAPRGKGGGVCYTPDMHAVIVGESAEDLQWLGRYLSKFPDQRAQLPNDDPAHLAMLNERAEQMNCAADQGKIKLTWHTQNWRPGERFRRG